MSETAAQAFISRLEDDAKFAGELEALKDDPQAVLARVRAEGFLAEPAEVRAAFLDRHGAELSPEQLDTIAGGLDGNDIAAGAIGSVVGLAVIVGAAMV
jgi:predicted ribosomally synthesized peptide with nif11-like leader